jgi:transcriptional regulator with XRE-family HTH domain
MIKNRKDTSCIKFGSRLKYLRLAAGMSQEELAHKAELDRTYIGGIERGERNPSLKNIIRLADALKTTPDEFFTEGK